MIALIVLNIILIILLIFSLIYFFRNKNEGVKCDSVKDVIHNQNKKIDTGRVYVGRFVSDDEYHQMIKSRKSDISILIEEVEREYEYLKELNK